jgi:uncharacterized protein (TIGR02145 family)
MTKDKSKSLTIHHNNSLARVERSIALTNKLLSTIDETVTDIDGNEYKTVKIGNQVWMAENLKVTNYNNGDPIPTGFNDEEWANLAQGAYCYYNDDHQNINIYGNLYNGYAVDDPRGIAPKGLHVASDNEWMELEMFLGMNYNETREIEMRGGQNGEGLKLITPINWDFDSYPINDAPPFPTNNTGFSIQPSGHRQILPDSLTNLFFNTNYDRLGLETLFWCNDKNNKGYKPRYSNDKNNKGYKPTRLFANHSGYYISAITRRNIHAGAGLSIRCIKD